MEVAHLSTYSVLVVRQELDAHSTTKRKDEDARTFLVFTIILCTELHGTSLVDILHSSPFTLEIKDKVL